MTICLLKKNWQRLLAVRLVPLTLALAALALFGPRAARGQDLEAPRGRQGYYVAVGAQGHLQASRESGRGLGPWTGAGGALRVGQLVNRRLGFGLELAFAGAKGDGHEATLGGLLMTGQLELLPQLALHAGAGIGFVELRRPDVPGDKARGGAGASFLVGLSYDWMVWRRRVSGGLSVTPRLDLRHLPGDGVATTAAFVGVDLVYWSGLPREQLELPPGEGFVR
jgi:hypothetical protein